MENKEQDFKKIIQQDFKDKLFESMKENLIFSLISFIFAKILENESSEDRKKFQKDFITFWKKSVTEISQAQLAFINKVLNDNNIDMINIIAGENQFADIEDYQSIINENIKEIENIFWKICGDDIENSH